jgi:hypothetical protein
MGWCDAGLGWWVGVEGVLLGVVFVDVPSLHHSTGEVAAVLALYCDVFGALELGTKGWVVVSSAAVES